jgi:hypothetical protein
VEEAVQGELFGGCGEGYEDAGAGVVRAWLPFVVVRLLRLDFGGRSVAA